MWFDAIKKFFCGDGEYTVVPSKSEHEIMFEKFMNDVISDDNTYFNAVDKEGKSINFLCDHKFYDTVDFFYKKNKQINIRHFSCYDKWHNVDVELDGLSITDHNFIYGQYYFVLSYDFKRVSYHSVSQNFCEMRFPEHIPVDMDTYKLYEPDLKKYGFKLDYKNGKIYLIHPKKEEPKKDVGVSHPCPACGNNKMTIKRCFDSTEGGISGHYVMCNACGMQSPKAKSDVEAVRKWDDLARKVYDC